MSLRKSFFVTILVVSLGLTALAHGADKHSTSHFTGTSSRSGKTMRLSWSAWFDASPEDVSAHLRSWKKSRALLDRIESFSVTKSKTHSATIKIEIAAPVFISNPTMTLRATHDDGTITWKRVAGSVEAFEKRWVLTPEAGGTRVECTTRMELPFEPPSFMMADPEERLGEEVTRFRDYVRATKALAKAP